MLGILAEFHRNDVRRLREAPRAVGRAARFARCWSSRDVQQQMGLTKYPGICSGYPCSHSPPEATPIRPHTPEAPKRRPPGTRLVPGGYVVAGACYVPRVQAWARGFETGEDDALKECTAAMARLAAMGNRAGLPAVIGMLAELQLSVGRFEEAHGAVETALSVARATDQPWRDADLHRLKGEICRALPDHDDAEAEALFWKGIEIARGQHARSLELRATMSLARLWRGQSKCAEARELLQPVYDWFTEGFDTQDLKDAKALLQELG